MTFADLSTGKENKEYNLKEGFNYCWATPILKRKIQDSNLLDKVANYILLNYIDNKKKTHNLNYNLLEDNFFDEFKEKEILPVFEEYLKKDLDINLKEENYFLKSWLTGTAISFEEGRAMPKHNHSDAHLSAIFYILSEEKDLGGSLVICDPRFNANRGYHVNLKFKKMFDSQRLLPKTGDILVFPSFTYHSVDLYYGKLRLAMPVDLFLYDSNKK
jgi:hypothetical protein